MQVQCKHQPERDRSKECCYVVWTREFEGSPQAAVLQVAAQLSSIAKYNHNLKYPTKGQLEIGLSPEVKEGRLRFLGTCY
jgi:hypothetical protein